MNKQLCSKCRQAKSAAAFASTKRGLPTRTCTQCRAKDQAYKQAIQLTGYRRSPRTIRDHVIRDWHFARAVWGMSEDRALSWLADGYQVDREHDLTRRYQLPSITPDAREVWR